MQRNFLENSSGLEDIGWSKEVPNGCPESVASRTASFLYKHHNIPKTLGESTKHNSSCRKFQNHEIQSRHHHGGVHHPHWCLSDAAWVVHFRPTGP